jgi:hypothetical protein
VGRLTATAVLSLQREAGNAAVGAILGRRPRAPRVSAQSAGDGGRMLARCSCGGHVDEDEECTACAARRVATERSGQAALARAVAERQNLARQEVLASGPFTVDLRCPGTRDNVAMIKRDLDINTGGNRNMRNSGNCDIIIGALDSFNEVTADFKLEPGASRAHFQPPPGSVRVYAVCSSLCSNGAGRLD